jgi:hypothetical protein
MEKILPLRHKKQPARLKPGQASSDDLESKRRTAPVRKGIQQCVPICP